MIAVREGQCDRRRCQYRPDRGARSEQPLVFGRTLRVSQDEDGALSAVFADAGSGRDGAFRFRFVSLAAPSAGDGATELDLNRAYLPPCAFADHFICPFPPPGNTLAFAVPAGEKRVLQH